MSETQESPDADTPLAAQTRDPPGDTAQRSCPLCDDGVVWEDEATSELVCDSCHAVLSAREPTSTARKQTARREERQQYDRDAYDTYDHSNRMRLHGGYEHAYYAWNGREYALDTYDEVTDGLWTPHKRG